MVVNSTFIFLLVVLVIVLFLLSSLVKLKPKNDLYKHFVIFVSLLLIPFFSLSLQILFSKTNIKPIYFDYFTYIFTFFAPIEMFRISVVYSNQKLKKWIVNLFYILSTISLIVLWTNDVHHLFYVKYSVNFNETVFGPAFYVICAYEYGLLIYSMINLGLGSTRKSGFFSIQTFLILLGISFSLTFNLLSVLKIIKSTVYLTPLTFVVLAICLYISIFKLKALNIVPVASRTVMDTMSDAYVVISNDGTIADSNKTFREKFGPAFEIKEKQGNLFDVFDKSNLVDLNQLKKHIKNTRKEGKIITQEYHFQNNVLDRYFEVDIHPISSKSDKNDYIATLLLFKDITQHKLDIQEIEEKQDIIVKQQQLVSIGELAGGVAHDINTPISAIKTGITMLSMKSDRPQEEKDTLQRMDNCATKIINIVNSMRNQIRNLGNDTKIKFKISSVINDIKVITYHELMKNHTEININIEDDVEIEGDPTKLGQVLTNLIVNASQAYGEKEGKIDIIVRKTLKHATITVIDYAGGMDDSIKPYVFKNILTTKGTAGTGLGLYLAYSVIKGNFNGEIDFDSKKGEGTSFHIRIPLVENNDVENKNN